MKLSPTLLHHMCYLVFMNASGVDHRTRSMTRELHSQPNSPHDGQISSDMYSIWIVRHMNVSLKHSTSPEYMSAHIWMYLNNCFKNLSPPQKTCHLTFRKLPAQYQKKWKWVGMFSSTVWLECQGKTLLNSGNGNVNIRTLLKLYIFYNVNKFFVFRSASFVLAYLVSNYNLTLQQVIFLLHQN